MNTDQVDTIIVGIASLCVAGLSFIYASKAQRATRLAEAARERGQEIAVDAQAYLRARDMYESAIKTFSGQNEGLNHQVAALQADNDRLARRLHEMDSRIAALERALRAASIEVPPWPHGHPQ